jgi:hypothetical protein
MENEPTEPNHEKEIMYIECDECGEDFVISPENSKTQVWTVAGYQHLNFIALTHTEECETQYRFINDDHLPYLMEQSVVYYADRPSPEALKYLSDQYAEWHTEEDEADEPIDVKSIEWSDVMYDFLTKYQPEPWEFGKFRW